MIVLRPAMPDDAHGIADVHVASWRTTYPGMVPDHVLTGLSVHRLTSVYRRMIRSGGVVHVAVDSLPEHIEIADAGRRVVGFITARRTQTPLADSEIETLYLLDDYCNRGYGRLLVQAAAGDLAAKGTKSLAVWVLSANPSRWFYARLGGRLAADDTIFVGGVETRRTAFVWDPISRLVGLS